MGFAGDQPAWAPGRTPVKGRNKMPAHVKKITEADVNNILAYVRSVCK